MSRPYRKRQIESPPRYNRFRPAGRNGKGHGAINLSLDELEAIRLADYLNMDHAHAASRMEISRPTFSRLVERARHKVAEVLIEGKEVVIQGGNIGFVHTLYRCRECGGEFRLPRRKQLVGCGICGSVELENLAEAYLGDHENNTEESGGKPSINPKEV